jgi:hypothetical protein
VNRWLPESAAVLVENQDGGKAGFVRRFIEGSGKEK